MDTSLNHVFLTGATGFVGGSILSKLVSKHPALHVTVLVRQEKHAEKLRSIYNSVEPIIGTLSDLDLVKTAAAAADIVVHAAHDNIPAAQAMIDGLASSPSSVRRFLSVTGPRSLVDQSLPLAGGRVGSRAWSDVMDAETIASLPEDRPHAEYDQAVISHGLTTSVGTMLVSPGQLIGQGLGHFKREGAMALYYATVRSRGRAFVVGDGEAAWSWTSVRDMADAVVLLIDRAVSDEEGHVDGYYFVQTGDVSLNERAQAISERLGLGEAESISAEQARDVHPFGPLMWGADVRFRADKLKVLGWTPKERDWRALLEQDGGERA